MGWSTALFKTLQVGDSYQNVVGPLGRPTEVEAAGTAICVGGGTGVAVLYPIARKLKSRGSRVISIIGARNEELIILRREMETVSDELLVCTDTGTIERNALVTDLLMEVLDRETPDVVVAIGPVPMMKRVSEITKPLGIKTIVSLNPIMIDGTGMCGGCRVTVGGVTKFACVDGPDFDGHQVDWAEAISRSRMFRPEEQRAMEKLHKCRLTGGVR